MGSLSLNTVIALINELIKKNVKNVGDIKMTGKTIADNGWLICDGSAISRTQYSELFSAIGTVFGTGNGSSTFNIPDFRSRVPLGAGQGEINLSFASTDVNISTNVITIPSNKSIYTGTPIKLTSLGTAPTGLTSGTTYYAVKLTDTTISLATTVSNAVANPAAVIDITGQGSGLNKLTITYSNRSIGEIGGEENHSQNISELVKHTHIYNDTYGVQDLEGVFNNANACDEISRDETTSVTGGSVPFNVMNPYLGINFMIKY
jgi:microcystin-dependent protein